MIARHRKKALLGAIGLGSIILALFAFTLAIKYFSSLKDAGKNTAAGQLIKCLFVLIFFAFFACLSWTCYHIAKGKGYSGALAVFGILVPPMQILLLVGLLALDDKHPRNPGRDGRKKPRRQLSNIERIVRSRRNALVGNCLGLFAIALGVFFQIFRVGIFRNHADEWALGLLLSLAGYAGVICGCWWWLKAKGWNDAVVFIGLAPLTVYFIPYVRWLFVAIPYFMPACFAFMPLVLLVVVFTLPDRSGWEGRKRWRIPRAEPQTQIKIGDSAQPQDMDAAKK